MPKCGGTEWERRIATVLLSNGSAVLRTYGSNRGQNNSRAATIILFEGAFA